MSSLIYLNTKITFDRVTFKQNDENSDTFSNIFMVTDFDFFALIYKRAVLETSG